MLGIKLGAYHGVMWIAFDFYWSFDTIVHWMVCLIYLRVTIEAKYLLDLRTYAYNSSMQAIDKDKDYLSKANILMIVIFSLMLIGGVIAVFLKDGKQIADVISSTANLLQFTFFIMWACSLVNLFKTIKSVQQLLPHKRIFVTHGALIGTYLVCILIQILLNCILRYDSQCELINCVYMIYSIHDLLNVLAVTCDYLAYLLVLYMLVPSARRK